ncbi:MAG: hypothetical protein ACRBI6_16975 [Acidimicrobiales bacterium]
MAEGPIGASSGASASWRARARYWKVTALLLLVVALVVPVASSGELAAGFAMLAVAAPLALWLFRIGAWEEESALVVRNFFGTKRIPWTSITKLEVSRTFWSSDWCYVTARHGIGKTRIKALVLVPPFSSDRVIDETRELARRRDLVFDKESLRDVPGRRRPGGLVDAP